MWWLVLKVLWSLIPAIIAAVKEQKIKTAAREEVVDALRRRIETAKKAKIADEKDDPHNRRNQSK